MPAAEPRLRKRYALLVQQHVHAANPLSAGPSAPLGAASAFAATQACWRFLNNERMTLPQLAEPLWAVAEQWRVLHPEAWALAVHDWSALSYPTHGRKKDRKGQGSAFSAGYDLATLLLVDGRQGDPVVPLELELRTGRAVFSTRPTRPKRNASHLDSLLPAMRSAPCQALGERVIHIIDREADSVGHYRAWDEAGQRFLIRSDDTRLVRWEGTELPVSEVQERLHVQGRFRRSRDVLYRGTKAIQHVAETTVVLDRPAYVHRRRRGKVRKARKPGKPITLRLIVSRVCDAKGKTLAMWPLLSNAPAEVDAATLALWYYWRWRIESFFKLLKSAGQAVEQWQQQTGAAIARRLLVAAMACALVWKIERATGPEAISFRDFLVRLSGRQMKYGKTHTAPAVLAGLWAYLTLLDALDQHSPAELRAMKAHLALTKLDSG